MKIGELARITGVAASTIRFYEERGLMPAPSRGGNGYRDYDQAAVAQLNLLRSLQNLGFSLDVIQGLFADDGRCSKTRTLAQLDVRLEEIDMTQAALAAQRRQLVVLRATLGDKIAKGGECDSNAAAVSFLASAASAQAA